MGDDAVSRRTGRRDPDFSIRHSDEMNGDTLLSFKDAKAVSVFEEAIRTTRKQPDDAKRTDPDHDVMVIFAQQSPIHAIKLWLGEDVYVVSAKHTDRMRELTLPEGR